MARQLAGQRRDLMRALMQEGISQVDLARELGVSRQAVQKMLAC
jgi:predicted transcriptional regulator